MNYLAFLLGINVGGNRKVPMGELRIVFEKFGFTNVKTLLNSGNVLFSTDEADVSVLRKKIEEQLAKSFGFEVKAIVRTQKEIQEIVTENPFKDVVIILETRLYVTFLSEEQKNKLQIPYESPEKNFKILEITHNTVISVLILSEKYNTTDAMKIIGKEFGRNITTRNWNTVVKLSRL